MIKEQKNPLLVEDKNILALIVKIELALQAYLARVKLHKQAPIALEVTQSKKAVMPVNLEKALALEIQTPKRHAASVVVSNKQ